MFDITSLAVSDTSVIHIKNAAGEPVYDEEGKPVTITVYGPGSKAHGVVESRQSSRALKRMQDNDGKITAPSAEERAQETAEDLAALTVEIGFAYPKAKDKKGAELFQAVYSDPALGFITRQVAKHIADWANFKAASASS